MTLLDTGARLLELAARKAPKAQADTYLLQSESWTDEWSEGAPENRVVAHSQGLGLRLIYEGRLGFGYSNGFDKESLEKLLQQALDAAKNTAVDPLLEIPAPEQKSTTEVDLHLVDPALENPWDESRSHFLSGAQADVLKRDPRFTKVLRATYREGRYETALVNSRGISVSSRGTSASYALACVAVQDGETQIGYGFQTKRYLADLNPAWVTDKTVANTLGLLGGKQVPSGRYDLVLDPFVAAEMLELFAGVVQADQVLKGKSFLGNKVGQSVGAACLTLVDDGRLPKGLGSSLFDGEGVATQKTIVLEGGVLNGFLYDSYNAKKAGKRSTGNAGRGGYRSVPGPETTNFYLQPGSQSPETMVSKIHSGILVHGVMGLHTVDTISGDYSLGLMGERIEHGRTTHGVRRVTMAGNMLDLLKNVEAVGSDLTFSGSVGSPTLWIRDVSVGGS